MFRLLFHSEPGPLGILNDAGFVRHTSLNGVPLWVVRRERLQGRIAHDGTFTETVTGGCFVEAWHVVPLSIHPIAA